MFLRLYCLRALSMICVSSLAFTIVLADFVWVESASDCLLGWLADVSFLFLCITFRHAFCAGFPVVCWPSSCSFLVYMGWSLSLVFLVFSGFGVLIFLVVWFHGVLVAFGFFITFAVHTLKLHLGYFFCFFYTVSSGLPYYLFAFFSFFFLFFIFGRVVFAAMDFFYFAFCRVSGVVLVEDLCKNKFW